MNTWAQHTAAWKGQRTSHGSQIMKKEKHRPGALTHGKDLGTFLAFCTLPVMGRFVFILHSTTSGIQKEDNKKTVLHVLVCQYSGSLTLHPDL